MTNRVGVTHADVYIIRSSLGTHYYITALANPPHGREVVASWGPYERDVAHAIVYANRDIFWREEWRARAAVAKGIEAVAKGSVTLPTSYTKAYRTELMRASRAKWRLPTRRRCRDCEEWFEASRDDQRYCSGRFKDKQRLAGQLWQTYAHLDGDRVAEIMGLLSVSERTVQAWQVDAFGCVRRAHLSLSETPPKNDDSPSAVWNDHTSKC